MQPKFILPQVSGLTQEREKRDKVSLKASLKVGFLKKKFFHIFCLKYFYYIFCTSLSWRISHNDIYATNSERWSWKKKLDQKASTALRRNLLWNGWLQIHFSKTSIF